MQLFDLTNYIVDMIYELVPDIRRQGHNQLNFRCPICGDGKKKQSRRGHFYLNEGTYYCWNAGCPANGKGMSRFTIFISINQEIIYRIEKRFNSTCRYISFCYC